ncbi:MAG: hypothetical protein BWK80_01110 [Desulfobacteraceae bacterium IS3]|nr:MAG: hypothetical protein BWK80_01110 [Desulfobacteraceae bacterium IS3]
MSQGQKNINFFLVPMFRVRMQKTIKLFCGFFNVSFSFICFFDSYSVNMIFIFFSYNFFSD